MTTVTDRETEATEESSRCATLPSGDAVIDRGFTILRSFDSDHRRQSLAAMARRAGLPRSTALRLARRLVDAGALERLEDGSYVVGLGLLEIASLAPRGQELRDIAVPYLHELLAATRHHVVLAVRDGDESLLIEHVSSRGACRVDLRVGGRAGLPVSGTGLVLLASAPFEVQERVFAGFHPVPGDQMMRSKEELRGILATIRRQGHIVHTGPGRPRISAAAAPVHGSDGQVAAAVSVAAPSADFHAPICVPAVRASARVISARLRGSC